MPCASAPTTSASSRSSSRGRTPPFDLHEWPDGSYTLELVDDDADRTAEATYDLRSA